MLARHASLILCNFRFTNLNDVILPPFASFHSSIASRLLFQILTVQSAVPVSHMGQGHQPHGVGT